jgi:hypothetical protein
MTGAAIKSRMAASFRKFLRFAFALLIIVLIEAGTLRDLSLAFNK